MKKIKNVVIINDFNYTQGGASKVAIDTANLICNDYRVYFFSGASNNEESLDKKVIDICTNQGEALKNKNKIVGALNGIYNFKAAKELKKLLMNLDKDETIIHVHGWTKCLSCSVFNICWKMGFKVLLTMHDYFTACPNGGYFNYKQNRICDFYPLSWKCIKCNCDSRNYFFKLYRVMRQFVQNKIVKLNDKLTDVVSISKFSEDILKKTLNSETKIHRVYNPIDLDDHPLKVDYKKNEYFLYVGRVSKEKGVDLFCEALSDLKLPAIVVGDGDEREYLEKQYPDIQFVGWKNSTDVKEFMKNAKALIALSRWFEGAPLTPLEAMQYGIPVITSDCNAAKDYISEGENGYVVDINNLDDIKSKILKINNNDNVLQVKNQSFITSKDSYRCNIEKLYEELLNHE